MFHIFTPVELSSVIKGYFVLNLMQLLLLVTKGGATIVIGGTMSLPILMSAGDRGYKIIR